MRRLRSLQKLGAAVAALAGDPVSRAWAFTVVWLLPLKRRVAHDLPVPVRLALEPDRSRWFWFSDDSELIALVEIFAEDEYAVVEGVDAGIVVDLGANVGQAALWLRSRFPAARILSVEPDPRTFAKLERNLGRDPLVTLRQVAITAQDGWTRMQRAHGSSWGTRVSAAPGADLEYVPSLSLETLLAQHGIDHVDLLKVDIEGMEHEALGASRALERTTVAVGEIHRDLIAVSPDEALEDMRRSGGFARYELRGDVFMLARA